MGFPARRSLSAHRSSAHRWVGGRRRAEVKITQEHRLLPGGAKAPGDNEQLGKEQLDLRRLLAATENASPIDAVDVLAGELTRSVNARHAALLIANFSGTALVRLSHVDDTSQECDGHNERVHSLPLAGTEYEQVLFTQTPHVLQEADHWMVLVPVTERGDVIGILEVALRKQPDAEMVGYLGAAAHALAYVLIASRRHTDVFEWAQRDIPFSVPAEIQRRLLPSAYALEAGPLTLAGWLEPSHDAGGDTFDYSLDREYAYVSMTDAMGHSTDAALLATLVVGTLRNRRRSLLSPAGQADAANQQLRREATFDQFVTGLLLRIRLADGVTEIVNAGHPTPFLLRDNAVTPLEIAVQPPLGVSGAPYWSDPITLVPGDRLLLITDGYLERRAARVDIEEILIATRDRHPRQIVQELARKVVHATGGNLQDDATALCIDWYGPAGMRGASDGASQERATS